MNLKDLEKLSEQLEIRSEEVQEIMGYIPRWIIRWGITLIFLIIITLLVGSWFFKYPDVITSTIIVTTENPPASLVAKTSGKIEHLFVKDNQSVYNGAILAVIENPVGIKNIFELKKDLDSFKVFFENFELKEALDFSNADSFGELQQSYSAFLKSYDDYQHFIKLSYHKNKIASLKEQLKKYNSYYYSLKSQMNILEKELSIGKQQYERSVKSFEKGIISKEDFENSESILLQKEYSLESSKSSLANTQIQIAQLKQNIVDLELQEENEKHQLEIAIKSHFDNLVSQISLWEERYILYSPIDGVVTFNKYWSINQNVNVGDIVLTVIPHNKTEIIGKLSLPVAGAGKVKKGQKVNIKFLNYPYMQYGMVRGKVENISLISSENFYSVEVSLPNGLITNYKKELQFSQEMQGIAEIITEDISLFFRLLQPIKAILEDIE